VPYRGNASSGNLARLEASTLEEAG
jgi:hypothetical protein